MAAAAPSSPQVPSARHDNDASRGDVVPAAPATTPVPRLGPRGQSPLLEIRDLAVSFENGGGPRIAAVDGVSLSIFRGQTLAVVGESGCGKSVSALATMGLLPAAARVDRGQILFAGDAAQRDMLKLPANERRRMRGGDIAMIFQEPMTSLNPVLTIGEQIIEAIVLHQSVSGQTEARARALAAMDAVGIQESASRIDQYPHQFSGGMRQRIMIAMAIACEPMLLLADEPTTALDVTVQAQVLDLLAALRMQRQMGLMLISHDLGLVRQRADVVCVMYAGRVVEYASASDVFLRPLHPYTRALLACAPRVGERRTRLATVRETVDVDAAFAAWEDNRPWWLWHKPPAEACWTYALREVCPARWIGVWTPVSRAQHP